MKNMLKFSYLIRLPVNWGNYWQVVYTTYANDVKVKSITYPFSDAEIDEIQKVANSGLMLNEIPLLCLPVGLSFKKS